MDISITLIGVVILLLIIAPLIWVHLKEKKEEKRIAKQLQQSAKSTNAAIEQYDIWGNFAIGIDDKNTLHYMQSKLQSNQQFNLNEFKKCQIINSGRVVENDNEQFQNVRKLELALLTGHFENEVRILFYDINISMQINYEIILVKKWKNIISNRIAN